MRGARLLLVLIMLLFTIALPRSTSGNPDSIVYSPNAPGDLTQLSLVGSSNWGSVDEYPTPNDGDYVYTGDTADFKTDLYNFADPGLSGTINSITIRTRCLMGYGAHLGSAYSKAAIKIGGVVYYGTERSLPTDNNWHDYDDAWTANPNSGSAWTWEAINSLQIGVALKHVNVYYVTSCSQVYITIIYNPSIPITVTSSPSGSGFVKVDDTPITTPKTYSWMQGESHEVEALSPVSGATGTQYVWSSWSDSGDQTHTYTTPSSTQTVTASYTTQYYLTINSEYGSPTGAGWYNSGSQASFSVTSPVSGPSGTQYVCTGYSGDTSGSGPSGSVTMNGPKTVTFNWGTQYQVTFTSSGVGGDSSGTVVTINGNAKTQNNLPYTAWYDSESTINYEFSSTVSSTAGKRYVWTSTSGCGQSGRTGSFQATGTGTVTGTYKTQYQVSVTINPSGGGSVSGSGWFDDGSQCTLTATASGGYRFNYWSGDGSGSVNPLTFTVNSVKNVVANFIQTAQITITSNPTGSGFVKVDGNTISTPQIYTWDVSSGHALEALSPVSGGSGIQYVWTSWSDGGGQTHTYTTPSSAQAVTATYKTQYYLTMSMNPSGGGSASPSSSWHDSGSQVLIQATPSSGYTFSSWSGSGSGSYTGSDNPRTIAMSGAISETANFELAITTITFQTSGLSGSLQDVLTIDGSSYDLSELPKSFQWIIGSEHDVAAVTPIPAGGTNYVFSSWTNGDGLSGPVGTYTVPSSTQTVTANYLKQYLLTIEVNNPFMGGTNPEPGSYYYDAGTSVQVTANPNPGYNFTHWLLDGNVNTQHPITVVMSSAHTLRAFFSARNVNVTITSNPTGEGFVKVDGTPIVTPQIYNYGQGETHSVEVEPIVSAGGDKRYVWSSWSDGGDRLHTITAHGSTMTVSAIYKTQYTLKIENVSEGGVTNPSSGVYWYDDGQQVYVSAIPADEWDFDNWILDGRIVGENPIRINMDQNHTLQAIFKSSLEPRFTVTVVTQKDDGATIRGLTIKMDGVERQTDSSGRAVFKRVSQGSHTLEIPSPSVLYEVMRCSFTHWGDGGAENPRVLVVDGNLTFVAFFSVEYKLIVQTIPSGLSPQPSASPSSPDGFYSDSVVVQVTAPDVGGMGFYAWTVDGVEQPTGQKTVSVKMDRSLLVTAIYTQSGFVFPQKKGEMTLPSHDEFVIAVSALLMLTLVGCWKRRRGTRKIPLFKSTVDRTLD